MARYTINLTDTTAAKLAAIVDTYNANSGTALTVTDWITLHLRELAIQSALMTYVEETRKTAEQQGLDAVAAERQRLLDENL